MNLKNELKESFAFLIPLLFFMVSLIGIILVVYMVVSENTIFIEATVTIPEENLLDSIELPPIDVKEMIQK